MPSAGQLDGSESQPGASSSDQNQSPPDQQQPTPQTLRPHASHDVAQNRQQLSKMLQLHGYSACREALVLLEDHFTSSTKYESMEDFISKLNRTITFDTDADSSVIDSDLAYLTISKLRGDVNKQQHCANQQAAGDTSGGDDTQLPSDLPIKVKNVQCSDVHDKTSNSRTDSENEFNIHYNFLLKRLSSLPVFQGDFQLMKLATLTASSQPSIRCICFGLLIKDISKIDGYMLIDNTGRVPVRITPDTAFKNRLSYANCIVLVEGVYVNPDDVLFAANIGLPPILLEPIQHKSLACADDKLVVLLKELYLDDEDVCKALDILFTGYNAMEDPPILFILIGDFTREPCNNSEFRGHMKKLIRIIRACDNLKSCHYVFVPGQRDTTPMVNGQVTPQQVSTMPKPPLSKEQLPLNLLQLSNITNVHLATNPAHIYLGDRQISLVAHSYFKKLHNNLLHDLSDHREELFQTAKQIVLSNAHFSAGVTKSFHSSMNIWHKPDLLILADTEAIGNRYEYNSSREDDTTFATLPSFSRSYNQFKVYYVKSGEIDDSQVSLDAIEGIEGEDDVQVVENEPSELDD